MAYICICKAISEKDLADNPSLCKDIGTGCGTCLLDGKIRELVNKELLKEISNGN